MEAALFGGQPRVGADDARDVGEQMVLQQDRGVDARRRQLALRLLLGLAGAGLLVAAAWLVVWLVSADAPVAQADWSPTGNEWSTPDGAHLVGIEALGGQVYYYDRIIRLVVSGKTINAF